MICALSFCFDSHLAGFVRDRRFWFAVNSFGREVKAFVRSSLFTIHCMCFVRQFASGFGSNGEVSGVSAGKVRVLPYCRG